MSASGVGGLFSLLSGWHLVAVTGSLHNRGQKGQKVPSYVFSSLLWYIQEGSGALVEPDWLTAHQQDLGSCCPTPHPPPHPLSSGVSGKGCHTPFFAWVLGGRKWRPYAFTSNTWPSPQGWSLNMTLGGATDIQTIAICDDSSLLASRLRYCH